MNILYYADLFPSPSKPTGGIFNYHRARALRAQGLSLSVARAHNIIDRRSLFSLGKDYALKSLGYDSDIEVSVYNGLSFPRWGICWRIAERLADEYRHGGFDLIHSHFVSDAYPVYIAHKRYGLPYVVTAHGSDIHTHPFQDKRLKNLALEVLNHAEMSIFVSRFLLNKARELGFDGKTVTVVPNGYDPGIFSPPLTVTRHREESRKEVGFVGALSWVKGADRLPEIFSKIFSAGSGGLHFTIIGEGPLRETLATEITALGLEEHVTFQNYIAPHSLARMINQMDALILPSRNEGWPCVLMESQACGVPVVATRTGGIPEAIGTGGTLILEGPDFEERFAQAVGQILEQPPASEAMQAWSSRFTWEKTVGQEIQVYREVIAGLASR